MKKMILASIVAASLWSGAIFATSFYQTVRSNLVGVGNYIEKTAHVPVIGKLTNLLPFAIIAASFKECPFQTLAVLTGVMGYALSQNAMVQEKLSQYEFFNRMGFKKNVTIYEDGNSIDDSLFYFEGDTIYDAEQDEELENELLFPEDHSKDHHKQDDAQLPA
jgi:hypothetical protein